MSDMRDDANFTKRMRELVEDGYLVFAKLGRWRVPQAWRVPDPVIDLQVAINRFVAETNLNPKPFVWDRRPETRDRRCQTGEANVRVSP